MAAHGKPANLELEPSSFAGASLPYLELMGHLDAVGALQYDSILFEEARPENSGATPTAALVTDQMFGDESDVEAAGLRRQGLAIIAANKLLRRAVIRADLVAHNELPIITYAVADSIAHVQGTRHIIASEKAAIECQISDLYDITYLRPRIETVVDSLPPSLLTGFFIKLTHPFKHFQ
jgi:hypothetical protein